MKFTTIFAIAIALLLVACSDKGSSSSDVSYTFASAQSISDSLGHGINLGNALDAPNEGDWGVTLKEEYFSMIADSGFQSVRIPVRWSAHALTDAPYTIDTTFLNRVRWAVDLALAKGLRVVIDMHHYDSLMVHPESEEPRFLSMWAQISKAFSDYPPALVFELLNEPKDQLTSEKWNLLLAKGIKTIRAIQPKRTLMVGTAPWGGIAGLSALVLPADTNLIVTVHYYEPHQFTHQGAKFEAGADAWLGKTWRATPGERIIVDNDMARIATWAKQNKRPVYLGEFGTYFMADSISRAFYTEYLTRRLDSLGISWAMWNFSSDFGIYNDTTQEVHQYLTQALLHPGHNAALDSAMATGVHVDLNKYVLLDAFDTHPEHLGLPETAWKWLANKDTLPDSSHAAWYVFQSPSSNMFSGAGDTLLNITDILNNHLVSNFPLAIGNWGETGNGIHLRAHLLGDSYPWVGFGVAFTGWNAIDNYDLCALTAVSFKAKGTGEWWMQVITDTVNSRVDPDSTWGHFGAHFNLSEDWQDYIITVDNFNPKIYSPQWEGGLLWKDGCKLANALEFMNGHSYGDNGEAVDTTLEMQIDDIRLLGLDPLPIR